MNYFIYAIRGENIEVAIKKRIIGLSKALRLLNGLKPRDRILFYKLKEGKFIARGIVGKSYYLGKKIIWPDEKIKDGVIYKHRIDLKKDSVKKFKHDVDINRVLYGLHFIKNKEKYGGYLRTTLIKISKSDYEKILLASNNASKIFGLNLAIGNSFQNKAENVFKDLGFEVLNRKNQQGPDLIIKDREFNKEIKIIVQCKAAAKQKTFSNISGLIDEYSTKVKKQKANLAIILLSNLKISHKIDVSSVIKKDKVAVLTEDFLDYYAALRKKINKYAKYQFLADIGIPIHFERDIKIPALQVKQSGYTLYVAALEASWLLKSSAVLRRISENSGARYQRILNTSRVKKEIPNYLMEDWVLPNNLVLSTKQRKIHFANNKIILPSSIGLFWVVDGQHRLYSFANIPENRRNTKLLCTIFDSNEIGSNADFKLAKVFVDLNLYAKKVDTGLIIELSDIIGSKDPKLRIALNLYKSPVFATLVSSYSKKGGVLNLTTLATNSAMNSLVSTTGPLFGKQKISEEKIIKECTGRLTKFFKKVAKIFEGIWGNRSYILSDNRGIRALLKLYVRILRENGKDRIDENINEVLKKLHKSDFDFSLEIAKGEYLGEAGADKLAKIWLSRIKSKVRGVSIGDDIKTYEYSVPKEENEEIEFKESMRWDVKQQVIKDDLKSEIIKGVAAMMNTQGGSLFIGIKDTGEIVGIDHDLKTFKGNLVQQKDEFLRTLKSSLRSSLRVAVTDENIEGIQIKEVENRYICEIRIKKSTTPIFWNRKFYRRDGASSFELKAEDLVDYLERRFPKK